MKNKRYLLLCLMLMGFNNEKLMTTTNSNPNADKIWNQYEIYKEQTITSKFFKHKDVAKLIEKHTESGAFKNEILGYSVEGRSINHLTIGKGKTKVLLWSQMHGDESTATMALFDLFNFLSSKDENDGFRNYLLENLELHFVPMVNPDGAEVWKRRNALGIDLNRDAVALVSPESNILKNIGQQLKPEYGFNLHDQSTLYSVGKTKQPATISFLAPAYNYAQTENDIRKKAIQLIVSMNKNLQKYIPGKVAKYNDEHEPRAFGDNYQGWGISTILVESGGYKDDFEKQYMRKLNFYTLLQALETICNKSHEKEKIADYYAIKENSRFIYDLVVKNITFTKNGKNYKTNIGVNQEQISNSDFSSFYFKGSIAEIGDMQFNFGYDNIDANEMLFIAPKVKLMEQAQWEKMSFYDELKLVKEGYLYVSFTDANTPSGNIKNRLLNLTNEKTIQTTSPQIAKPANFILTKNDQAKFAVINGFLVDLSKENEFVANTIGY